MKKPTTLKALFEKPELSDSKARFQRRDLGQVDRERLTAEFVAEVQAGRRAKGLDFKVPENPEK